MTPRFFKAFWLTVGLLSIVLWFVAGLLGWVNSPAFISHISMAALVLAAFGAWQSTRVEVNQDDDADVREVLDEVHHLREES